MRQKPITSVSSPSSLSKTDLVNWVRLLRSENVGPVSFRDLLSRYKTIEAALEALPTWARRGGRTKTLSICSIDAAEKEIENHDKIGAVLIALTDPRYPSLLKLIHDPPPLLSVRGNVEHLHRPMISVVGARNASLNGKKIASTWAKELGEKGFSIVSGLARGIDTAAHEGSLSTGTVAVVAGGIDQIYPPENEHLYHKIVQEGVIIAEAPFGTIPQASYFPRRNRLISGLCQGLLIVEAALKSGSLITARFALEHNREVCAVPGSPLDPRCFGTNQLIQQGAALVQSAQDICEALERNSSLLAPTPAPVFSSLEEITPASFDILLQKARPVVLENLGYSPIHIDELIRSCHFSASVVMTILLELDLAGRLDRQPGLQICLRQDA